jgi:hypothetical protein
LTVISKPDGTGASQTFSQTFSSAFYSQDADGDTHVVMMDDAARKTLDGQPASSPVRQVMHIHVLWKPTRDMKSDHNSSSNATLHWYVMKNGSSASDVIEYAGTAMVVLEPGDGTTDLSIRIGSFRAVASRGGMRDPLGPATLRGTVRAKDSVERVRLALKSVGTTVAAANTPPANAAAGNAPELPSSSAR